MLGDKWAIIRAIQESDQSTLCWSIFDADLDITKLPETAYYDDDDKKWNI